MQADVLQSVAFEWTFKLYLADHITPATGKTVAITLSKAGATSFSNPSAGASTATEKGNGWYFFISSTTDTGTLGPIVWLATCTGCDNADQTYQVVKATNGGMTGIPDAVAGANAGLPVLSSSATTLAYTVSTVTTYTGNIPQTGDSYALIGATGSGLTSLAPSSTALSTATWTSGRASNLDFLDVAVSTRLSTVGYTAPDNSGIAAIGALVVTNLNATVSSRSTYAGIDTSGTTTLLSRLTSTRADYLDNLSGGAVALASGVILTSAGLDAISITAPTGVASNFREMMIQLWRRFFKKTVKTVSGTTIITYADNGTTPLTTQIYTDDIDGNQSLGAAS